MMRLALVLFAATLLASCGAPSPARDPSASTTEAPVAGETVTLDVPELL